jgi:hypothetical protein
MKAELARVSSEARGWQRLHSQLTSASQKNFTDSLGANILGILSGGAACAIILSDGGQHSRNFRARAFSLPKWKPLLAPSLQKAANPPSL